MFRLPLQEGSQETVLKEVDFLWLILLCLDVVFGVLSRR